ncbi:MAG: TIGR03546 family protein [Spirochaetaceae bacterium]|nr:TIGR03546 family protein [Spirochaetaceae bacterium]
MILIIVRIIGSFASYGKPRNIAFAMALGLTLAFIPGGTLLWFLLFIPMMFFRINQAALIGMMAFGRLFMPLLDIYSERIGYFFLTKPGLYEPMGRFLSLPMIGWFRFDDSLITGGLILGIAGLPVWFFFCLMLVGLYRKFLAEKIKAVFQKVGQKAPLLKKMGMALSAGKKIGVIS